MRPIQLAFRFLISCRIFLCSLTLSDTSSFLWSLYPSGIVVWLVEQPKYVTYIHIYVHIMHPYVCHNINASNKHHFRRPNIGAVTKNTCKNWSHYRYDLAPVRHLHAGLMEFWCILLSDVRLCLTTFVSGSWTYLPSRNTHKHKMSVHTDCILYFIMRFVRLNHCLTLLLFTSWF